MNSRDKMKKCSSSLLTSKLFTRKRSINLSNLIKAWQVNARVCKNKRIFTKNNIIRWSKYWNRSNKGQIIKELASISKRSRSSLAKNIVFKKSKSNIWKVSSKWNKLCLSRFKNFWKASMKTSSVFIRKSQVMKAN